MFVLRTEFILLRHALSASVTNWISYRALYAEIALPRICLSYLSGDPRFAFKRSIHLLLISSMSSLTGNEVSQYVKVVCFSLMLFPLLACDGI